MNKAESITLQLRSAGSGSADRHYHTIQPLHIRLVTYEMSMANSSA